MRRRRCRRRHMRRAWNRSRCGSKPGTRGLRSCWAGSSPPWARQELVVHQKTTQLLAAARVAELAQRLGLYLADALAGDIELLADLLESVVGVHVDAEAHAQHLRLARRELRQHRMSRLAQ